jgi:hypothetical protein
MAMDVLIPVFVFVGLLLPLTKAPRLLTWLMPVLVAVAMGRAYLHERSASGDSQPGLVLLVGIGATIICVLAILLGSWIARSMRPDTR